MIVEFESPEGSVAILGRKIVAIVETTITGIECRVFVDGDDDPYNSSTTYDSLMRRWRGTLNAN